MPALDIIADLARRGARLSLEGDTVIVRGPRDILTPELRAEIKAHKPALVRLLRDWPPAVCPGCGNRDSLRWLFTARGRQCWACGWTRPYQRR